MLIFSTFDRLARNDFWTESIENINRGLEKNALKDQKKLTGITLVAGFPLPEEILHRIEDLKSQIDAQCTESMQINWREKLEAFHITVSGLVVPKDYRGDSWEKIVNQMVDLQEIFDCYRSFPLTLQGFGILGRGAISLRVSDSPELTNLRKDLSSLEGISQVRFGGETTKVVIGRVKPGITESDRDTLKTLTSELESHMIGTIEVETLKLVHYNNTFLEDISESIQIN